MNVVFDLDGTLTDSRQGIVNCLKHALRSLDETVPDDSRLASLIGDPLRGMFEGLMPEGDADRVDEAVRLYRDRFKSAGMYENRVYAGIRELLATLVDERHRLFVATSKPEVFAREILAHFGLSGWFAAIHGSGLDGKLVHKHELLFHVLRENRLSAVDTVMIGDRHHDVKGAKHNSMASIGVLWGYGSMEELRDAGAGSLASMPDALPRLLAQ